MAFTHRFADINALDTYSLVKLMSDPQKAAEYWERYAKARDEYDVQKAAIADENAKLNERLSVVEKAEAALEKAKAGFAAEVEKNDAEWKNKKALLKIADEEANKRKNAYDAWQGDLDRRESALKAALDKLAEDRRALDSVSKQTFDELRADEAALVAREAAVAKREDRANKLTALLKEV
jgi:chromosome segregation ATPase